MLKSREEYPRWGKNKLVILLRREEFASSASTVGRILKKLKERGVLKEPSPNHISARKSQRQRPYAVRKPEYYVVKERGDIVEVDTFDVRPLLAWCLNILLLETLSPGGMFLRLIPE